MTEADLIQSLRSDAHIQGDFRTKKNRYYLACHAKSPERILIKGVPYIITANEHDEIEILENQSVYIEGAEIKEVFQGVSSLVHIKDIDLMYDASDRGGIVLTPGFINAHAHPTMYLMRSAMLLDYGQHLDETIAKMPLWQKHIKGTALITSILGDITEQQKSGITTTLNHNAIHKEVDEAADLCHQRIINCISAVSNTQPDITPKTALQYITSSKRALSEGGIAIHYLYKIKEEHLKQIAQIQKKYHVLVTIHFAESEGVVQKTIEKFGVREVELLRRYGLLNPLTLLSHVLHVTNEEIQELIDNEVGIVHLPTSNTIHKSGVFKYPTFARMGGSPRVALGTDSVVSKSRLDLLSEAFQTRVTHLPDYTVYYEELFKMITVNAARVVNQPKLGRIAPGYKADIAFWKLKDRRFIPFDTGDPKTLVGNIISHGGRNIRDLMVDGKFVISNRVHNLVNESELLIKIQKYHMEVRTHVEQEKIEMGETDF